MPLRLAVTGRTRGPEMADLMPLLQARGEAAAVYRHLLGTDRHPTADEVFTAVRGAIPDNQRQLGIGAGIARNRGAGIVDEIGPVADPPAQHRLLLDEIEIYAGLLAPKGYLLTIKNKKSSATAGKI